MAGPQLTDVERTDTQLPCSTLLTIDEGEARRTADVDLEGTEDEVRHLGGGLIEDERSLRSILEDDEKALGGELPSQGTA